MTDQPTEALKAMGREPTAEMIEAGRTAYLNWREGDGITRSQAIYRAMHDAAPSLPAGDAEQQARELLAEALRDRGYSSDADYIEQDDPDADLIDTRAALAAIKRALSRHPTQADLAAFGASDAACYLYPGEDQQKERSAFCEGAAHAVSSLDPAGEAVTQETDRLEQEITAWAFAHGVDGAIRNDLMHRLRALASSRDGRVEGLRVDIRGIALQAIKEARQAGESQEMLARRISERVHAALIDQPRQKEEG